MYNRGANRVFEPPKWGIRTRGVSGYTAGLRGRSIDTMMHFSSPCVFYVTLQSPDTHGLAQNNNCNRFRTDLGPVLAAPAQDAADGVRARPLFVAISSVQSDQWRSKRFS